MEAELGSADLVGVEIDKEVVRRVAERSLPAGLDSEGPSGLRFSVTPRTVCGAAIYSDANRQHCEPSGFLL